MPDDIDQSSNRSLDSGADDPSPRAGSPSGVLGGTVTDRRVKLGLTFVVAFCSIAYELVYSEFLTVFYGGTVVRYSITIGLFMFSLGVGAVLSSHLQDPESSFLRTEVYLAFAGPAGAGWIIALNSFPDVVFPGKYQATLLAAHLPIVVVGLLSGFEVPLLNELVADRDRTVFAVLGRLYPRRVVRRLLGVFYPVSEPEGRSFSEVLGVDYLGSLAGTVVYALVLYPTYGLVVAVLVLGLLNALAALTFAVWTLYGRPRTRPDHAVAPSTDGGEHESSTPGEGSPPPSPAGSSDSETASGRSRPTLDGWLAIILAGLVLTGIYGVLVANAGAVDRRVTSAYMADRIESEYRPEQASITPLSIERTKYQKITKYRRNVTSHEGTETCLRLDAAIQLCDSWVDSYHSGLVDMPMSAFENQSSVDVLLIGGGDYIAVDHLREYNVSVDQIDIDGEFLNYTKNRSYFEQFHDDAYRYDRLNTTVGDAFAHLQRSEKQYDLILLDIPGARSDDSLALYSTEFYSLLRDHLTDRGVVATWVYSRYWFPEHHKAYVNTIVDAGFDRYLPYSVYNDLDDDGEYERGERFYILSDGPTPTPDVSESKSEYLKARQSQFGDWEWQPLPEYRGVEVNSVFDPNYDIIVKI